MTQYDKWELAVLAYNSNDTNNRTGIAVVNLNITGIPVSREILYVVYKIDDEHGNPYSTWKKMMSPVFPTGKQFHELRLNQVTSTHSSLLHNLKRTEERCLLFLRELCTAD